jgi:hypothetical protein
VLRAFYRLAEWVCLKGALAAELWVVSASDSEGATGGIIGFTTTSLAGQNMSTSGSQSGLVLEGGGYARSRCLGTHRRHHPRLWTPATVKQRRSKRIGSHPCKRAGWESVLVGRSRR